MTSRTDTPGAARAFGSDETMPWLFRAADAASGTGQRSFMNYTSVTLLMLLLAAAAYPIITAISGSAEAGRWAVLLGAAGFVVAIIERSYSITARPERPWYEGRALAESTKTLAWRYAVGAAPYDVGSSEVDRRFARRLRVILTSFPDLVLDPHGEQAQQITPEMRALRNATLEQRKQAYRQYRIEDQRSWYAGRASKHGRRGQRLALLSLLAECCGATLAILFVGQIIHTDFLGIAAAAASGIMAWEQAHQDTTIAKAYGIAAQELATISDLIDDQNDEENWSRFVVESEDAISREHTLWKASRSVDTSPADDED